jgi:hypothetical protein
MPTNVKYEVFMVVKIQVQVSWVVMPCDVVVGYQHFRGPSCLHLQSEDLNLNLELSIGLFL